MLTSELHDIKLEDALEPVVLPPELFPLIADALVEWKQKKTLAELLCANSRALHSGSDEEYSDRLSGREMEKCQLQGANGLRRR